MSFLSSMNISASAMTAQRLRLDIASENIANIDTKEKWWCLNPGKKITSEEL